MVKKLEWCFSLGFSLCLFSLVSSCNGQGKNSSVTNAPAKDTTIEPLQTPHVEDPYFVETTDIESFHGPGSIVRTMLQDAHGNLWFATWEGIVRYDGKIFTNETLKNELRHFHTFSVLDDKRGNLWFGSIRGGAYRFDGKDYTLFTTSNGLPSNIIECMLADNQGNIWFGTDNGVSRYDGTTFTNFTTEGGFNQNWVHSIAQDKTGKIWFGTNTGVICYDGHNFVEFLNRENKSFSNVRSILQDSSGIIWIGGQDGLYRYNAILDLTDGRDLSLTKVSPYFTGYLFEDSTGILWVSHSDRAEGKMTLSKFDGNLFDPIFTSDQVFGICEDNDQNIWFGTVNGVSRYDGHTVTLY